MIATIPKSGCDRCRPAGYHLFPPVSLFGPGRAKKWAPRGERHLVIDKGLTCSPCTTFGTTPPCPIAARCMRDITVDEVCNAVTVLLTATGAFLLPAIGTKKERNGVPNVS